MAISIDEVSNIIRITETPPATVTVSSVGKQGPKGDPGEGIPTGGTTGQVLAKVSNADGDTTWETLGTMASQNAVAVAITGGTIDGTNIGMTVPAIGVFSTLTETSDIRLKAGIKPLKNCLSSILRLRPVKYLKKDTGPEIGLIAQEVEKVFPEMVAVQPGDFKTIQYARMVAPLIGAVQTQQKQIWGLWGTIVLLAVAMVMLLCSSAHAITAPSATFLGSGVVISATGLGQEADIYKVSSTYLYGRYTSFTNLNATNVSLTGNLSAVKFIGDGSLLTGISSTSSGGTGTISGTGLSPQVALWNTSSTITGDSNFVFTSSTLGVNPISITLGALNTGVSSTSNGRVTIKQRCDGPSCGLALERPAGGFAQIYDDNNGLFLLNGGSYLNISSNGFGFDTSVPAGARFAVLGNISGSGFTTPGVVTSTVVTSTYVYARYGSFTTVTAGSFIGDGSGLVNVPGTGGGGGITPTWTIISNTGTLPPQIVVISNSLGNIALTSLGATGTVTASTVSATFLNSQFASHTSVLAGTLSGTYVYGQRASLTALVAGTISSTGGISVTGNLSANKLIGDCSLCTGISGGTGGITPTWALLDGTGTIPPQVAVISNSAGNIALTNLGATGIITASTLSASNIYSSGTVNVSGTVYATALVGDGSGLTNVSGGGGGMTISATQNPTSGTIYVGPSTALNATGRNNTALGANTMLGTTGGTSITAIGFETLRAVSSNMSGVVAVGTRILRANTSGVQRFVGVGDDIALTAAGNFTDATAVGYLAGGTTFACTQCTLVGSQAGDSVAGTTNGTYVGYMAGHQSSGSGNSSLGSSAGNFGSGISNNAVGMSALSTFGNKSNNNALGSSALAAATTGSNNLSLGTNSCINVTTGTGNICIGDRANAFSATVSGSINIARVIYGDNPNPGNGAGRIGVNITSPSVALEVSGTISGTAMLQSLTEGVVSTTASTATTSLNSGAASIFYVTASSNTLISLTNGAAGRSLQIFVKQDATGGRAINYTSPTHHWNNQLSPTLITSGSTVSQWSWTTPDGSNWFGGLVGSGM